jgi:hypothetical protein
MFISDRPRQTNNLAVRRFVCHLSDIEMGGQHLGAFLKKLKIKTFDSPTSLDILFFTPTKNFDGHVTKKNR